MPIFVILTATWEGQFIVINEFYDAIAGLGLEEMNVFWKRLEDGCAVKKTLEHEEVLLIGQYFVLEIFLIETPEFAIEAIVVHLLDFFVEREEARVDDEIGIDSIDIVAVSDEKVGHEVGLVDECFGPWVFCIIVFWFAADSHDDDAFLFRSEFFIMFVFDEPFIEFIDVFEIEAAVFYRADLFIHIEDLLSEADEFFFGRHLLLAGVG